MRITHPVVGDIEYDPSGVIEIAGGLVGLPSLKRFVVVDIAPETPFRWLQSVDEAEAGFLIAEPSLFLSDYRVELRREEQEALGLSHDGEAAVFVIVRVSPGLEEMAANLRGPVVVNLAGRRGLQAVLTDPRYPLQQPLRRDAMAAFAALEVQDALPEADKEEGVALPAVSGS
jgi:flagellar assembly factor FliW